MLTRGKAGTEHRAEKLTRSQIQAKVHLDFVLNEACPTSNPLRWTTSATLTLSIFVIISFILFI